MAKMCDTCGRGSMAAHKVSHSQIKTKTRKHVNLQTKRLGGKRYRLCTSCIRTMAKKPELLEKAGKVEKVIQTRTKKKATK